MAETLLMTRREVADACRVAIATIDRMRAAGKLPESVRVNGSVRYRRDDIIAWLGMGCPSGQEFKTLRGRR